MFAVGIVSFVVLFIMGDWTTVHVNSAERTLDAGASRSADERGVTVINQLRNVQDNSALRAIDAGT